MRVSGILLVPRSVTFVVSFLGQFLGRDVCLSLQKSQGGLVFLETGTFPSMCR